jgi:predicted nuclease of predicted toxin-antitoxin system
MRRIILDQGLPAPAAGALSDLGWEAVHVRELDMHTADDSDILMYAVRESRVVITLDRDFPRMLALLGAARPSVVLLR